jgi:hypothetical protein
MLIHGCDFAAGEIGPQAVDALATLTGAGSDVQDICSG